MTDLKAVQTLNEIAGGALMARCVQVIAEIGVADALGDTPRTPEELAAAVDAHPGALGRVLRLLSSHGIFEDRDGRFAHSPASRFLRSDHPQSMRTYVRRTGMPRYWDSYQYMEYTLRTGRPAIEKIEPDGPWAYFAKRPEESKLFTQGGETKAQIQIPAILSAYDFSPFAVIGDIGGGSGYLLEAILRAMPEARGVLFDLPHVATETENRIGDRMSVQPGDFFKDDLPVCDIYLMLNVIHDWDDEETRAIFEAVRRVAPEGAKLLVMETLVPESAEPHPAKSKDVTMLVVNGGRERTEGEFDRLFTETGFRRERTIPLPEGTSILEAAPQAAE